MTTTTLFLAFAVLAFFFLLGGVSLLLVFLRLRRGKGREASEDLSKKLELLELTIQKTSELTSQFNSSLKQDVFEHLKSSRDLMDNSSRTMREQVRDFTESMTKMHGLFREMQDTVAHSTEKMTSFQNIFKTPKLRGQWGESSLDYMLVQMFSADRILRQYYFKSGDAVDFAVKLPSDLLLPIDSKFPWETYSAYAEEEDEHIRTQRIQVFARRVREEIDSIAAKYIRPGEGTTDLALMFIPAEAVYYDILFHLRDLALNDYAQKKRVIMTSPNTLYLALVAIQSWFRDVTLNKQTQEIRRRLSVILTDGKKLGESFERLGKHINNARGAFEDSEKRLGLLTGRVRRVIGSEENSDEAERVTDK
ncbi:MAG: DNA recombination protein RmuC [Parcubacteria group bacterium]|nr:DNA recombination protein RmuC [Parcubacteria group bacterium]